MGIFVLHDRPSMYVAWICDGHLFVNILATTMLSDYVFQGGFWVRLIECGVRVRLMAIVALATTKATYTDAAFLAGRPYPPRYLLSRA